MVETGLPVGERMAHKLLHACSHCKYVLAQGERRHTWLVWVLKLPGDSSALRRKFPGVGLRQQVNATRSALWCTTQSARHGEHHHQRSTRAFERGPTPGINPGNPQTQGLVGPSRCQRHGFVG